MTNSPHIEHWIAHLDASHYDINLIQTACDFALTHESNDTLYSLSTVDQGITMADALIPLHCDSTALCAAILYPCIFYQKELIDQLQKTINPSICKIILGAMQIDAIHHIRTKPNQVESLRKMLLAMVDDIRTILVKLAERLFLLKHCDKYNQQRLAQETMDFYAPLANRLGIGHIKWQLEDWAFRYLDPTEYHHISKALKIRHKNRVRTIHEIIAELKKLVEKQGLKNAKISGRVKHIYSIYKKTKRKNVSVEKIYDVTAVRILLPDIEDCYTALSLVHHEWESISEEFDDYINNPKPNGYQSIHTAILRNHTPIEIQIRTFDMHAQAELGVAAHWKYKENKASSNIEEQKILLLRELLDFQHAISTEEKQQKLYHDAFHDRVYVFSPNSDVFDLKAGATPLDFAYLIHTNIGHHCRGAKVNGKLVPLTHTLQTGERVDILTGKQNHPSRDWLRADLGYLKTLHAIRKVRQWFYKQNEEKSEPTEPKSVEEKIKTDEPLIPEKPAKPLTPTPTNFTVAGTSNLLTQLAQCCHPIPGDKIIGYITQGRGITVHQKNCRNIQTASENKPERLINITWKNEDKKKFRVTLFISADDRPGLLRDITSLISQLNLSILSLGSRIQASDQSAIIELTVEITSLSSLNELQQKIKQIQGVNQINRK